MEIEVPPALQGGAAGGGERSEAAQRPQVDPVGLVGDRENDTVPGLQGLPSAGAGLQGGRNGILPPETATEQRLGAVVGRTAAVPASHRSPTRCVSAANRASSRSGANPGSTWKKINPADRSASARSRHSKARSASPTAA